MFQKKTEKIQKEIEEIQKDIKEIYREILDLKVEIAKNNQLPSEIKQNVEELILWKGKILDMAIGKTPKGKEKINRFGKKLFSAGMPTRT